MIIPIPTIKQVPNLYKQTTSSDRDALTDYLDTLLEGILDDIINLRYLYEPERCPEKLLKYLSNFIAADIQTTDSDRTKRQKIYNAITTHKNKDTWTNDLKLRLDAITGYNSELAPDEKLAWVLTGDGSLESGNYYSSLGCDGSDLSLGLKLLGGFDYEFPGCVAINLHTEYDVAIMTNAELAKVVAEVSGGKAFAYIRLIFGYINADNKFIDYQGIYLMAPFLLDDLTTFKLADGTDFYYNTSTVLSY